MANKLVDFLFDAAGQPDTVKRYADLARTGLVAESDYRFDLAGRLTDLTHREPGTPDTIFADHDLTWDGAGRITDFDFMSLMGGSGDADYSHDDTNQLTVHSAIGGALVGVLSRTEHSRIAYSRYSMRASMLPLAALPLAAWHPPGYHDSDAPTRPPRHDARPPQRPEQPQT